MALKQCRTKKQRAHVASKIASQLMAEGKHAKAAHYFI